MLPADLGDVDSTSPCTDHGFPQLSGLRLLDRKIGPSCGRVLLDRVSENDRCAGCHKGSLALEDRLRNMTLVDIAVDMWNHAPRMMQPPPPLTQDEMRQLLSFLWMRQFV